MNKRNIYIVFKDDNVVCYSNLAKAIKQNPLLSYYSVYRDLLNNNKSTRNGYAIFKTVLK